MDGIQVLGRGLIDGGMLGVACEGGNGRRLAGGVVAIYLSQSDQRQNAENRVETSFQTNKKLPLHEHPTKLYFVVLVPCENAAKRSHEFREFWKHFDSRPPDIQKVGLQELFALAKCATAPPRPK